jgi:hypothetical protein
MVAIPPNEIHWDIMQRACSLIIVAACGFESRTAHEPDTPDPSRDASPEDAPAIDAADAATVPDAVECPPGYTSNAFGTCYRLVATPRTWQAAEVECEATGGHLVVVDDATENAVLPTSIEHWIGFSETVTAGAFLWVTGAGVSSFTGWAPTQPAPGGGACATTRPDGWHDDTCSELKRYLCEADGRPADGAAWN